jgi:cytochrome P450
VASQAIEDSDEALDEARPREVLRPPSLAGGSRVSGHLAELASDNLGLFRHCATLGPLVSFRVYWYTCHVLTDPDLAGEMLVTHPRSFKKTRALQVARPTFGDGLVTSEGEAWRRQQRLMRAFFTPRAVANYAELISETIGQKLGAWDESPVVDLHEDMVDVSLTLVCRALFGLDARKLQPLIRDAARAVQQWHSDAQDLCLPYPHYFPIPSNFRYRQKTRALDRAVYGLIREIRARGAGDHGLLGALIEVKGDDGAIISDREIRDQIVTLFLAGHDTTASSLALTLYELAYRPDLQAQIARESEHDQAGECLEHALKESLRLYPSVHLVARTALEDVNLGSYLIKRGEEVVLPLYVMQRSPKLFARPDDFWPERWASDEARSLNRYAYLPFSTGPRVCIGQALAQAELRGIITAILARFRLVPLAPRAPRLDCKLTISPGPGSTRVHAIAR